MRRLRVRKNIKNSKVLLMIIALVFFFTSILFKIYSRGANDRIIAVAKIKLTEFMQSFLSNNIGYDILKKEELSDILVINKNDDGEILYVDYNLVKAYYTLDVVTKKINGLITDLENGRIPSSKNVIGGKNSFALKVPLMISSGNILIANLGPDIYVPVNFVGTILTNIKSKITNYGLNNALVELYVTVKIKTNLITPVDTTENVIDYDVMIASTVINGRVPEIYGGVLNTESSILSIPIE